MIRNSSLLGKGRGGAHAHATSFTYDGVGNRLQQSKDGVLTAYAYDAANELSSAVSGASTTDYSYDANGNRASVNADGVLTTKT